MADTTQPGLKLDLAISGKFPLEDPYVATLHLIEVTRQTMDPEIRKRYDALNLAIAEAFWTALGVKL